MRYPIVCALFRFPRCAIKKRQHHLKIGGRNVERWPQVDNIAQRTDEEAEFLRSLADSPSPPGAARFVSNLDRGDHAESAQGSTFKYRCDFFHSLFQFGDALRECCAGQDFFIKRQCGERRRAGKGIAAKGVAVKERAFLLSPGTKAVIDRAAN